VEFDRVKRAALVGVLLCIMPAVAHAHLVSTGFGSFFDGAAHWIMTPRDVLVVIALGLLAGLGGAATGRRVLVALPAAWLLGGAVGSIWPGGGELTVLQLVSVGLVGGLVAADWSLPDFVPLVLTCGAGLLHGYVNGADLTAGGRVWLALLGAVTVVFVAASVLPAAVVSLRDRRTRVVVRVAGSWIAAIAILMFGWWVRTGS
jgi:hydrogenase/urease accessory protein HupE